MNKKMRAVGPHFLLNFIKFYFASILRSCIERLLPSEYPSATILTALTAFNGFITAILSVKFSPLLKFKPSYEYSICPSVRPYAVILGIPTSIVILEHSTGSVKLYKTQSPLPIFLLLLEYVLKL